MYQPRHFREEDPTRLHALVRSHAFATMIAGAGDAPEIAHVPIIVDADMKRLRMHVAMANPVWRAALAAGRVTFVFTGPHAYVSASWYAEPTQTVPTWNYAVVHIHGVPSRLDREGLLQLLDDLVGENEPKDAWKTTVAEPAMIEDLLKQIVGLDIAVTKLEGKFKLSQNRTPEDRQRVIDALERRGGSEDIALATLMKDAGAALS